MPWHSIACVGRDIHGRGVGALIATAWAVVIGLAVVDLLRTDKGAGRVVVRRDAIVASCSIALVLSVSVVDGLSL